MYAALRYLCSFEVRAVTDSGELLRAHAVWVKLERKSAAAAAAAADAAFAMPGRGESAGGVSEGPQLSEGPLVDGPKIAGTAAAAAQHRRAMVQKAVAQAQEVVRSACVPGAALSLSLPLSLVALSLSLSLSLTHSFSLSLRSACVAAAPVEALVAAVETLGVRSVVDLGAGAVSWLPAAVERLAAVLRAEGGEGGSRSGSGESARTRGAQEREKSGGERGEGGRDRGGMLYYRAVDIGGAELEKLVPRCTQFTCFTST